jgi:C1A family cysteine protease
MTKSKIGRKYGWRNSTPDQRDKKFSIEHIDAAALPTSVDLSSGMPEVWDQTTLGSCTSFSSSAAVAFLQKKEHPAWQFLPSFLFVYYNERVVEGTVASDSGAQIRTAIKVLASQGSCPDKYWTYDVAKFAIKPPVAAYKDAVQHESLAYQSVAQDLLTMKAVLVSGLPIVIGISVYESFESDQVAQTGVVPLPAAHEQLLGGHAVCVVGYNDSTLTFLVRNSWGTGWGLNGTGYFTIPYAYLTNPNLSDDFWAISKLK